MKKSAAVMIAFLATCGFTVLAQDTTPATPPAAEKHHKQGLTFEKIDANSDGKITLDEFKAAYTKADPTKAEAMFKKHDLNGDGSITKDEWTQSASKHKHSKNDAVAPAAAGSN